MEASKPPLDRIHAACTGDAESAMGPSSACQRPSDSTGRRLGDSFRNHAETDIGAGAPDGPPRLLTAWANTSCHGGSRSEDPLPLRVPLAPPKMLLAVTLAASLAPALPQSPFLAGRQRRPRHRRGSSHAGRLRWRRPHRCVLRRGTAPRCCSGAVTGRSVRAPSCVHPGARRSSRCTRRTSTSTVTLTCSPCTQTAPATRGWKCS